MKIECPVCGIEGFLEVRGNSRRVVHYRGFSDGKRVYERHSVGMGINGNHDWESVTVGAMLDGAIKSRKNVDKGDPEFYDKGARGLVRLRRLTDNQKIKSSNLFGPTTITS